MSTINLALNLELNDDLSEELLASITSALIVDLSRDSLKTITKVIAEHNIHNGTTATVNIKEVDETEAAKAGAKAALEALAVSCDARAASSDAVVYEHLTRKLDEDEAEDVFIEAGISGGFRAAAVFAREAIEAL